MLCALHGGKRDARQKVENIGRLSSRKESGCGGSNSSENEFHMSLAVFTVHTAHYHCHTGDRSGLPHVVIEARRWWPLEQELLL